MAISELASFQNPPSVFSVQELIKDTLSSVPPTYVHLGQENPNIFLDTTLSTRALPVIDFNRLLVSVETTDLEELKKLHLACEEWGFFQLVNHGISSSLLEMTRHEIEEFYSLPFEEKMKYMIRPGEIEGYGNTPRSGGKLDWGDRIYMTTNPIHRRKQHLFPELPASLRNTLEDYIAGMQKIGMKLLMCMAKALKMELKEMEEMFDHGFQSIKLTYYPPCPEPELVMGIKNHSDASGITILNQVNGVDGLQIKRDGIWLPVTIQPNALVMNVGDIIEILSNGAYKSVEHRVMVNSEKERMSVAFFMSPKIEAEVGPITSLLNPTNPPKFKRFGMEKYVEDFFSRKLNGKMNLKHFKVISEETTLPDDKHI